MKTRPNSASYSNSFNRSMAEKTVLRPFHIGDYDAVFALWQRCQGVGLGASDTRPAIAAYLRRNPGLSFVAQRKGKLVGAILGGHDGRWGYLPAGVTEPQRRIAVPKARRLGFRMKFSVHIHTDGHRGHEHHRFDIQAARSDDGGPRAVARQSPADTKNRRACQQPTAD